MNRNTSILIAVLVLLVLSFLRNERFSVSTGRYSMYKTGLDGGSTTRFWKQPHADTAHNSKPHSCGYQEFPFPSNHSGLPWLADVFRDPSHTRVVFVAVHRGPCDPEFQKGDDLFYFDRFEKHKIRFLCEFHPGNRKVLSTYVFPSQVHKAAFSFYCHIPVELRNISVGSKETHLSVSLYSLEDNQNPVGWNKDDPLPANSSVVLQENFHSINRIPVCSNLWHQPDTPHNLSIGNKNNKNNKNNSIEYNLIVYAMIKLVAPDYKRNYVISANETTHISAKEIYEWIEYHREVGVEHFVIYDNDNAADKGRLREILLPYIERGIVTLVWWPLPYCMRAEDEGWPEARGQYGAEQSALHRYGAYTRYYADIDVDEYLHVGGLNSAKKMEKRDTGGVPSTNALVPFLHKMLGAADYDVLRFKPFVFAACNGSAQHPSMPLIERFRCFNGNHQSDFKLVMKPQRILYYIVHYPMLTVDWKEPKAYEVEDATEGLLVHFQRGANIRAQNYYEEGFEGIAESELIKKDELGVMDAVLPQVKARLELVQHDYGITTTYQTLNLTDHKPPFNP